MAMKELQAIIRRLTAPEGAESVLATLVTVEGSSYRRPGARLLVLNNGTRVGSISGGCLEEDVMARAQRVKATGTAETVVYDTTSENDLVWGVGLGCHGVVKVLLERLPPHPSWARALADNFTARVPTRLAVAHGQAPNVPAGTRLLSDGATDFPAGSEIFVDTVPPPIALFVYGAGDDAQPLVRLAREMGWRVTVADPRAAFATAERFPQADELIVAPAAQLVARTTPGADALAVVMTHHYVHDVPVLRDLLARPLSYLGLLGPKKRATKILADLAADGLVLSAAQKAALHAPVGLDLGADAPEQVALAMVAEMQSVLGGRDAQPLNRRERPIHE
jgi:xanthine dehydrogenase accessory factor